MRGLLLEGVPAVGKSRALAALRALPAFQAWPSTLILGEQYTERAVEHQTGGAARRERLMYRLLAALEPFRVLTVESPALADEQVRLRYVFERFHLTNTVLHGDGDLGLLRRVENTLRVYQPVVVLMTVDPAELEARLADSLARGDEAFRDRLFRHGDTLAEVARHYAAQQEAYRRVWGASGLDKQHLDLSALTAAQAAERMCAWLAAPAAVAG